MVGKNVPSSLNGKRGSPENEVKGRIPSAISFGEVLWHNGF